MPGIFVSPSGSTDIHRVSGGQVELSGGFALTPGTRHDLPLPGGMQLSDFRWLIATTGDDANHIAETQRVPSGAVLEQPSSERLVLAGKSFSPTGQILSYFMDTTDGSLTAIGSASSSAANVSIGSSGSGVYLVERYDSPPRLQLNALNLTNGAVNPIGDVFNMGVDTPWDRVAVAGDGSQVLVWTSISGTQCRLYSANQTTGAFQQVGNDASPVGNSNLQGMGGEYLNGSYYVMTLAGTQLDDLQFHTVDITDNTFTPVGPTRQSADIEGGGIGLGGIGTTLYGVGEDATTQGSVRLYTVDDNDGSLSVVGDAQAANMSGEMGLATASDGPPYTVVSDYFLLHRSGQTQLQFTPARAGRVHNVIGVL